MMWNYPDNSMKMSFCFSAQYQLSIVQQRIVNQPFKLRMLLYGVSDLAFNDGAINIQHCSIIKPKLHAAAVHVEFAGDQFHVLVLLFML